MKFVSVQPATNYFIWQLEVLIKSALDNGYDLNDFLFVFVCENKEYHYNFSKFTHRYPKNIIIVKDDRVDKTYSPTIKIHGLYKLYKKAKHLLNNEEVFLHDSDIVFSNYFDFKSIIENENTVYMSDTVGYIGSKYLDSKSKTLTKKMCEIVGIDPKLVRKNHSKSGGAQLILPKNVDYKIWEKAELDAVNLYKFLSSEKGRSYKKKSDPYPVQAWTAEMWSVLWNIWLSDYDTEVHKSMTFSWPNWKSDLWKSTNIYHNSGVLSADQKNFFKGNYINKMPFGEEFINIKTDVCNYKYVEIIQSLSYLKGYYKY